MNKYVVIQVARSQVRGRHVDKTLVELISAQRASRSNLGARRDMVNGDHWLNGAGWIGPNPSGDSASRVIGQIEREFIYKNVIGELVRRHRDSLLGQEPAWAFTPKRPVDVGEKLTAEEADLKQEAESALTDWYDENRVHRTLQQVASTMLWAQVSASDPESFGVLRVYIPRSRLRVEDGETVALPTQPLIQTLPYISVSALSPTQAGVYRDEEGQPVAGWYSYKIGDQDRLEIVALAETLKRYNVETKTTYPMGTTVVQIRDKEKVIEEAGYDLAGRLLIEEVIRPEPLISDALISQQKLMNMALTMMGRNIVLAGYLERTIINAQMPGHYTNDQGNPDPAGKTFKLDPMFVGAGALNVLSGIEYVDETGRTAGFTTPSVIYRDPVSVVTFTDTVEQARQSMYEEAQQMHVLISGDATASGKSRQQATNDFVSSLGVSATAIERGIRWMLETVLALGAYFTTDPKHFESMRADASITLSAVQPSPEQINVNLLQYNAGVLSRETTMAWNGVEDVEAEEKRIQVDIDNDMENRVPLGDRESAEGDTKEGEDPEAVKESIDPKAN